MLDHGLAGGGVKHVLYTCQMHMIIRLIHSFAANVTEIREIKYKHNKCPRCVALYRSRRYVQRYKLNDLRCVQNKRTELN